MEKRALQVILGVLSLVPLISLALSFTQGPAFFLSPGQSVPPDLDNQFRYLSAVYASVSFGLWWSLPRLEESAVIIRVIGGGIFLGALGRITSMLRVGLPEDPSLVAGVALEGLVVPLLVLWQARIARLARS